MEMNYTQHGFERTKERLNLNRKSAARQMQLALTRGRRAEEFTSCLERNYLADRTANGCYAIAYNGACYIVNEFDNAIVTVYGLPSWWEKKKKFDGKERIKRVNRYYRMNDCECIAG